MYNIFELCTNLCTYLCTCVKERKINSNFISEVINIDFRQIWYFDMKGTGWVGLELSIIFTQTMGSFDM